MPTSRFNSESSTPSYEMAAKPRHEEPLLLWTPTMPQYFPRCFFGRKESRKAQGTGRGYCTHLWMFLGVTMGLQVLRRDVKDGVQR